MAVACVSAARVSILGSISGAYRALLKTRHADSGLSKNVLRVYVMFHNGLQSHFIVFGIHVYIHI